MECLVSYKGGIIGTLPFYGLKHRAVKDLQKCHESANFFKWHFESAKVPNVFFGGIFCNVELQRITSSKVPKCQSATDVVLVKKCRNEKYIK